MTFDSDAAANEFGAATSTVVPPLPAFWQRTRKKLLLIVLCIKLVSLLLVLCAVKFFPSFNFTEYQNDIHWPRTGPPTLATHFATWDGAHYLFLSEVGYQTDSPSCAFYPLWPWFIRT